MIPLINLSNAEAKKHFLKGESYFTADLPQYVDFEPLLSDVDNLLKGKLFESVSNTHPSRYSDVNYTLTTNKDGRYAWRSYELIHPVLYVSLVNLLCEPNNWSQLQKRFQEFGGGVVECHSLPVTSKDHKSDVATQVERWWQEVEQASLVASLKYSHLLHTDVVDCYGSLYSHSISWALHGVEKSKLDRSDSLLGNCIDKHIRAGRYGQTNGIAQGSVLMDFIAEIVLGYVDERINTKLEGQKDIRIVRYRDDYRIFTNSDEMADRVLRLVSDQLRFVGMKLGVAKTVQHTNVVRGAVKADKLAGIEQQDLGTMNAQTIQKQLLRLHSFGVQFPNSGALRRLLSSFFDKISAQREPPLDLRVQVAIATDIAYMSPSTFPVIAGILSHLISLAPQNERALLWADVRAKMAKVPYNGYLEIWLQRVIQPLDKNLEFESKEPICRVVNGESLAIWGSRWLLDDALIDAINPTKMLSGNVKEIGSVIHPDEVRLFKEAAWSY